MLTATYVPDSDHTSGGPFSVTYTVDQRSDSMIWSCTPSSVAVNQATTCTATVRDTSGGTLLTPTGTLTLGTSGSGSYTGTPCILAQSVLGTATCTVTYAPNPGGEGSTTLSATYPGDVDHPAIGPETFGLTVTKRSDTTALSCSPNPTVINEGSSCLVTVTDTSPGTAITPLGTVTFSSSGAGSFSSGVCVLTELSPGVGACSTTYTPSPKASGTPTLSGAYSGDTDHLATTGGTMLTVDKRSVSFSVACTGPLTKGQTETCTVTVTDISPGTAITPTGKVTFTIHPPTGAKSTKKCTLSGSSGKATCKITFTPSKTGSYTLDLTWPGDANHLAASTSVVLVIVS
jgi:Bacterial Ig-like domain (group 3)